MVPVEVPPPLRAIKLVLWLAAGCAARAGVAQPAEDADAALTRIVDGIVEARAEGGAYAKALIEPLTGLSVWYHERGHYALETVTVEDAPQVVRANDGLRSLEQAPPIRRRVRSEESQFDVTRFGTMRRIKVLDATYGASRTAAHRIARWLVDNRFRSRIVDGAPVDARFAIRHHVHE
jgi:hypothetical protein